MKVHTTADEEWRPRDVVIRFETQEEHEIFRELLKRDISIPDLVFPTDPGQRRTDLCKMMGQIFTIMK